MMTPSTGFGSTRSSCARRPTTFVEVGDTVPDLGPTVEVFVVKPAVGAGSNGTCRCAPDEVAGHVAVLPREGHAVVVTPYLELIDEHAETALVYFGEGRELTYDHAFGKGGILTSADIEQEGDFFAKEEINGRLASDAERALADAVLRSASVRAVALLMRGCVTSQRPPDHAQEDWTLP
jgi:hypothetical protein